jgi:hypothetical protein
MVRFEEGADALVMECMGAGRDEEGLADCYCEETCGIRMNNFSARKGWLKRDTYIYNNLVYLFWGRAF